MRVLFVHPSPLMYSKVFLNLEPLGLELVAGAARKAGHDCRLIDLQVLHPHHLWKEYHAFRPEVVAFSLNYLANTPEVLDLAKKIKEDNSHCFIFVGGHSGSFIADELLDHGHGAIDCVALGEGEEIAPLLLERIANRKTIHTLAGIVTKEGRGPKPPLIQDLNDYHPARDLTRRRKKYFIGALDPCASIEFTRGCPWDCNFCSAWTFYGRSYRKYTPATIIEDLKTISEPGVFIVDDVAFVHEDHGHAIADAIEKSGIKKQYYLETRCDVLIKNQELFKRWAGIGLTYMFLGMEAIDEEELKKNRKRTTVNKNFEALEVARKLGIFVAVNIIADPMWEAHRFETIKKWAVSVPEAVNLSIMTPYPGTEIWHTTLSQLASRDYRLFDIQHAVVPTQMPLKEFYKKVVETHGVLSRKHMGWKTLKKTFSMCLKFLLKGQTNFIKMLWKFSTVFSPEKLLADHQRPVAYEMGLPDRRQALPTGPAKTEKLYIHHEGLLQPKEALVSSV